MSKRVTELRIPKSPNDLRIKHLVVLKEHHAVGSVFSDVPLMVNMVHLFTGIPTKVLRSDFTRHDITMAYMAIQDVFSRIEIPQVPPSELMLGDKKYVLVDHDNVGVAWDIDFSTIDYDKQPDVMACLFYIPEGTKYGREIEHGKLETSISTRIEDIREHMPLSVFLSASAFFLRKLERQTRVSMEREKKNLLKKIPIIKAVRMVLKSTNGKG